MALEIFLTQAFTVDASDIQIFEQDGTSFNNMDFTVTCDLSTVLSTVRYRDQDSGDALFNTTDADFVSNLTTALESWNLSTGQYAPDAEPPIESTLGKQYIQYVASKLFGSPLAEAPIENDTVIETKFQNTVISSLISALSITPALTSNSLFLEIFGKMVDARAERIAQDDSAPLPLFASGDSISIKLTVIGKDVSLGAQTFSTGTVWKLKLLA